MKPRLKGGCEDKYDTVRDQIDKDGENEKRAEISRKRDGPPHLLCLTP